MGNTAFQWVVSDSATPPAAADQSTAATATPSNSAPQKPAWIVTSSKQNLFANPNREGLYPMQDAQGNTVQVPYSNVMTAAQQGYHVDEATRTRYAKDSADARRKHNMAVMQTSAFRSINWSDPNSVKRGTAGMLQQQPLPEVAPSTTPQTPGLWSDVRNAVMGATEKTDVTRGQAPTLSPFDPATGEMTINAIKQTGRVLFGGIDFPVQAWDALKQSLSDDPAIRAKGEHDLFHLMPQVQVRDTVNQLRDEWKRDPKLAASDVVGDAMGIWLMGKASDKVANAREGLKDSVVRAQHSVIQEAAGINSDIARKLVEKTNLDTETSIAKAADKNEAAAQKYWDDVDKAWKDQQDAKFKIAKDNDLVITKHREIVNKLERENADDSTKLTERAQKEQELNQATQQYYDLNDATASAIKAKARAAWKPWDEKTANVTVDGSELAKPLQKITKVSSEVARVLRQLTPSPEDVEPVASADDPNAQFVQERDAVVKGQGFKGSYWDLSPEGRATIDKITASMGYRPEPIDFEPEPGKPIPIRAIQRARSVIGQNIASGKYEGILQGEMEKTYGVLDSALRRASAKAGALEDFENANKASREYLQAFGRPHDAPVTAEERLEKSANPEAFKERIEQKQLEKSRVHNPDLVDLHNRVRDLRDQLRRMPSEDALRNRIQARNLRKPAPPSIDDWRSGYRLKPMPEIKIPDESKVKWTDAKIKTAQEVMDDLIQKNRNQFSATLKTTRSRAIWWTAILPWLYIWRELADSHYAKAGMMAIKTAVTTVGVVVTMSEITKELEKPEVAEYYSHPSAEQIAQLEHLSPESKRFIAEGFKNVIPVAEQHGIKVSPLIKAFVAQNAVATATQYVHTARNAVGHRIGTNDGGKTWYDIATGQQTHAAASQQP